MNDRTQILLIGRALVATAAAFYTIAMVGEKHWSANQRIGLVIALALLALMLLVGRSRLVVLGAVLYVVGIRFAFGFFVFHVVAMLVAAVACIGAAIAVMSFTERSSRI